MSIRLAVSSVAPAVLLCPEAQKTRGWGWELIEMQGLGTQERGDSMKGERGRRGYILIGFGMSDGAREVRVTVERSSPLV